MKRPRFAMIPAYRRIIPTRRNTYMKISKKDALIWFSFFAELPEDEQLMMNQ